MINRFYFDPDIATIADIKSKVSKKTICRQSEHTIGHITSQINSFHQK